MTEWSCNGLRSRRDGLDPMQAAAFHAESTINVAPGRRRTSSRSAPALVPTRFRCAKLVERVSIDAEVGADLDVGR